MTGWKRFSEREFRSGVGHRLSPSSRPPVAPVGEAQLAPTTTAALRLWNEGPRLSRVVWALPFSQPLLGPPSGFQRSSSPVPQEKSLTGLEAEGGIVEGQKFNWSRWSFKLEVYFCIFSIPYPRYQADVKEYLLTNLVARRDLNRA